MLAKISNKKEDLYRLKSCLKLNHDRIVLSNKTVFTGEELMLIGIHRLAVAGDITTTMSPVFCREYSQLSRAINWFMEHILTNFAHLLFDNMEFWSHYLAYYAEKIRRKLAAISMVYYPKHEYHICGFHDSTTIQTCRPGSGPRNEDGTRNCRFIQMAFYSGHKHVHGFKFSHFELPNGMTGHMYGPMSCRRNDNYLMSESKLNETLASVQEGNLIQLGSYGDNIYTLDTHLYGRHMGDGLTEIQVLENKAMKALRVAIEWNFGATIQLFPFLGYRAALKMCKNRRITSYYIVATLLSIRRFSCFLL